MKKNVFAAVIAVLMPFVIMAQTTLSGQIKDAVTSDVMAGASVALSGVNISTQTDAAGNFSFQNIKNGNYVLKVSYIGFKPLERPIRVNGDTHLELTLEKSLLLADEIIVSATRASANSATTFKNLSKEDIEKNNFGQDLPFLLNQTPSVVVSSDAGAGVGYTGIRIRGSDATRINVTINGIPYNDAESHGTFWVNLPDFASSVDNIQIQRGVGTSTNGAGAFGGSLNIQTASLTDSAFAEINNSAGSFGTVKNTVKLGTGLINGKWNFEGRLSRINSDGFIDRASSKLKSYFASGAYYGKSSILRANVFSGTERTYQAWNGVPEAKLKGNETDPLYLTNLLDHYYRNKGELYHTVEDSLNLFNSNQRKYNQYTYADEVDNYTQNHYQLLYSKEINNQLSFNGALHYTQGSGYFEQFQNNEKFSKYGLNDIVIGGETINRTDLVRRRWLDNDFYGLTYAFNYKPSGNLDLTLGGAYNEYKGGHFGEVIWARYASQSDNKHHYYDNDATKTDFNVFGKAAYRLNKLHLFADLQYRRVNYDFIGFNNQGNNVEQSAALDFFNPKVGFTYLIDDKSNFYASYAVANKEPNRDDFTESSPTSRPKHENLQNVEAGYRYASKEVVAGVNLYGMFYKNQLVLTGQINDVGGYIRSNVKNSYRIGAEADALWNISRQFAWAVTGTLSQNKIKNFSEFFDEYDAAFDWIGQVENNYNNTNIAFSPSFIGSSEISYRPVQSFQISVLSKYVSEQFLDNTGNRSRKLDAFFVNDLRLGYNFKVKGVKKVNVGLLVNNILNEKYESNGYSYGYVYDGSLITENFYFPQAGTNFMVSLNVGF